MNARALEIEAWLSRIRGIRRPRLEPASSDASFRRYFRLREGPTSWIVMDAPPDKEDLRPYLEIGRRLLAAGISVPEVLAQNLEQGFLLLTDLGSAHYLDRLTPESRVALYRDALDCLATVQIGVSHEGLPGYELELLIAEMRLFREWFLGRHLALQPSPDQGAALEAVIRLLAEAALEQPRCFVHRDYHSRNLMVLTWGNPGVLDFQGALHGPVTYDVVSLLRDCYLSWEPDFVKALALGYLHRPGLRPLLREVTQAQWLRWLDLMGVQRHLKAIGIFARLWYRDGKPHYLADIPRTLAYVMEVASRYDELAPLHEALSRLDVAEHHRRKIAALSLR